MSKKILSAALAILIIMSSFTAVFAEGDIDSYIDFVSQFNIIKGDPDGNFRLDDLVTRAEFTKIAVAASSFRNSVATNLSVSPFKDVPYSHWAAPYVQLALSNDIVNGYEDATFRPDNIVTYEEGITIFLKLLGYSDDDFGSSWPYAQVGIAKNIGLSDGVSKNIGDALSRRDCVILTYNLLNTKKNKTSDKYIVEFDSKITEDVILLATSDEDTSVGAGKVSTTAGTFKVSFDLQKSLLGRKGDLVIKDGDEATAFIPCTQSVDEYSVTAKMGKDLLLNGEVLDISEGTTTYYKSQTMTYASSISSAKTGDTFKVYKNDKGVVDYTVLVPKTVSSALDKMNMTSFIVYTVLDDKVLVYNNGNIEQINFNNSISVYEDEDKQTTYNAIKQNMEMGDILNVKYDSDGDIDYVVYEEGNLKGPITVNNSSWYSKYGITSDTKVIRDGKKSDFASLQKNDIVYYSKEMGMLFGYTKKVVGVYESATPNKDALTSVTVSGVSYGVESAEAFAKLSSGGEFNYGDTVTLLIGKDGQIADIVSSSSDDISSAGYLIETGNKTYTDANGSDYTSYYAKIAGTDGKVGEYKVDKDYKDYKNRVVTVSYTNGTGKISVQNSKSKLYGTFDSANKKLGTTKIADDVEILEVYSTSIGDMTCYNKTYLQRLNGIEIGTSSVLYEQYNENGEINKLILKDVTGDMYTYGAATTVKKSDEGPSSYVFTTLSGTLSDSGTKYSSVSRGTPVRILVDSKKGIQGVFALASLNEKVESLNHISLTTSDGKTYLLSPNVVAFKASGSAYDSSVEIIPIADVINGNYTVSAYYDKAQERGGRIRVIVAVEK